jgi:hypothetical protein
VSSSAFSSASASSSAECAGHWWGISGEWFWAALRLPWTEGWSCSWRVQVMSLRDLVSRCAAVSLLIFSLLHLLSSCNYSTIYTTVNHYCPALFCSLLLVCLSPHKPQCFPHVTAEECWQCDVLLSVLLARLSSSSSSCTRVSAISLRHSHWHFE